jgi:hypothetical protein
MPVVRADPDEPPTWSRIFLETVVVAQLLKKFPVFIEPEGSLLWSEEPATDP